MRSTQITTWKVSLLLFGSGMCALVYQMAWLREFRLIFGASTAASAAVLAIFMGGLGLGSLLLGHRADRQARPLAYYAKLELVIAIAAALTPLLLWGVRQAYIATGGTPVLGLWGATIVRLLLAGLVLVIPTFLMGGTLPAAARSVETDQDLGRRNLAFLYGANTLGAVTGSALATFFLVELFGTHKTLWAAALINILIAMIARALSGSSVEEGPDAAPADADAVTAPPVKRAASTAGPARADDRAGEASAIPAPFVLIASGVVGFAFLLMELVWYRMLGPILGGSTYTFGLILAVALLGIGLGGAAYAVFRGNRPATLTGFALTCALEAVFIAVPFALGDHLAVLTMLLRSLQSTGFWGLVLGWTLVTAIVVLPAAFISGVQFPLLIGLLGRGKSSVGRHIGLAYTANTIGAILGSLAGGFGLLPLLTAVNAWRAVVVVLAALAAATLAVAALADRTDGKPDADPDDDERESALGGISPRLLRRLAGPGIAAVVALLLILPAGPTAAWRHGSIGAGRSDRFNASPNVLKEFVHENRRVLVEEWDGVESSVALTAGNGYSFIVNGKSDGHIRSDAGTQIIGGLIGALVHREVKTSMVIGLGTGSTAGWLGAIPGMDRVDVVELESAILRVADYCKEGNQNVLTNPKVHISIGDAREALLTTRATYDLIFSEPSNPYRAGVASLYTKEFYEASARRLSKGGLFVQWLQAYEVDGQTVRTVYATLGAVFPFIETWRTQAGDMLLMAGLEPVVMDIPRMRQRLTEEPFRTAMPKVWRVNDVEGVLGRHIANSDFARSVAAAEKGVVNTDDHNLVEFSFARTVGRTMGFTPSNLTLLAKARGESRPVVTGGPVDWDSVENQRNDGHLAEGVNPPMPPIRPDEPQATRELRIRTAAMSHLLQGNSAAAVDAWKRQPRAPESLTESLFMAIAYNEAGSEEAFPLIERIRRDQPVEADALLAHLRWRQKKGVQAVEALESCFVAYRRDPWAHFDTMKRTVTLAIDVARADPTGNAGRRLYSALGQPFVLLLCDEPRRRAMVKLAAHVDDRTGGAMTAEAVRSFEPNVPWDAEFLATRWQAYVRANHPLQALAAKQLDDFRSNEPFPFDLELQPVPPPATRATTGPTTGPTTVPVDSLMRLPAYGADGGAAPAPQAPSPGAPVTPDPSGRGAQ